MQKTGASLMRALLIKLPLLLQVAFSRGFASTLHKLQGVALG
jgi:hypothetical protein